jgi:hypothetical protein
MKRNDNEHSERPADLCPYCDGLSPGVDMTGERIIHCPLCGNKHIVTPEEVKAWEEEMRTR